MVPKGWYVHYTEPRRWRSVGFLSLARPDGEPVRNVDGSRKRFLDAEAVAAELARLLGDTWMDEPCYFVDMWGELVGDKYSKIDWDEVLKEVM